MKVTQESILKGVHKAMDFNFLPTQPGVLDDGGFANVHDLFNDVEFAKPVGLRLLVSGFLKKVRMLLPDVLNMTKPVVDEAQTASLESCNHTAAPIVADDKNVFHQKCIHGELHDTQAV